MPPVKYAPFNVAEIRLRLEVKAVPTGNGARAESGTAVARKGVRPGAGEPVGARCTFSYSLDGRKWKSAGSFLAREGRWIGAKYGFFCNRPAPKNDAGCVDIAVAVN